MWRGTLNAGFNGLVNLNAINFRQVVVYHVLKKCEETFLKIVVIEHLAVNVCRIKPPKQP